MKRVLMIVAVGAVCAVSLACQPGAAGLSEQDKAAIRQLDDNWIKVMLSEKPDLDAAIPAYYAEDAKFMMEHMPTVDGRDAIKTAFSSYPSIKDFKLTEVSLEGAGDIAYRHYTYVMSMAVPGAPSPVTDNGKGIEVFRKQADGTWRVIRDIGNSDLPVPGLTVPTGAMAADASAEVKKLGDVVGRWQIDGKFQMDPKTPAGPVSLALDCQWFAGGLQVACLYTGTIAGAPFQQTATYSYNPVTKAYAVYNASSLGEAMLGKVTIDPTTRVSVYDTYMGGKPAKLRLTLSNTTPAGGDWKEDVSVAGGAWTVLGEGKYTKAK